MNLERPFPAESSNQSYLQPKLIPLLVLINQWGSQGHAAVMQTDCIVLILECLQLTFSKIHQVIHHVTYMLQKHAIFVLIYCYNYRNLLSKHWSHRLRK